MPAIDYETLPLLKRDAFRDSALYRMYFHWPVVFSRGCPHPCEYCAVQTYYQRSYRTRPVDDVLEDLRRIKALGGNRVLFLDDNPIAHPNDAKELFRAMIPLGLKWASQSTINMARDPELLDLAARSGCVSLSIGLESINEESLHGIRKDFNQAHRFRQDIAALRAKGIQVIALIMVGLDGDTPDTFGRTLQFLLDSKVSFLKLFTPCPYPGTKYYDDLAKQDRILDGNWARYDYGSPIIKPTGMTSDQMMDGFKYVYEGFYSIPSILRRFSPPPRGQLLESLRLRGRQPEGEPLPALARARLGDDLLARATWQRRRASLRRRRRSALEAAHRLRRGLQLRLRVPVQLQRLPDRRVLRGHRRLPHPRRQLRPDEARRHRRRLRRRVAEGDPSGRRHAAALCLRVGEPAATRGDRPHLLRQGEGNGAFELFAGTMATIEDPVYAPIEFVVDGRRSAFRVPGAVGVAMAPFVNPVSGEEQDVRVNLPKGFIWRSVKRQTAVMRILGTGPLSFDHSGQNAFYARLEFAGP